MRNSNRRRAVVRAAAIAVVTLGLFTVPKPVDGSARNRGDWIAMGSEDIFAVVQMDLFSTKAEFQYVFSHNPDFEDCARPSAAFIDQNRDGRTDIAYGCGPGTRASRVSIYGFDGSLLEELEPFGPGWTGGVTLATGNVAGNQQPEILISTQNDFGQVNFFRLNGSQAGFLIPIPGFTGGIQVFGHQLVPGGRDELIVVPRSQSGTLQILNADGTALVPGGIQPFGNRYSGGMDFAMGNWQGTMVSAITRLGKKAQLLATYNWRDSRVNGLSTLTLEQTGQFKHGFGKKGVHVAMGDVDADGDDEIVVGSRARKKQSIRIFEFDGTLVAKFAPFDKPMALTDIATTPADQ